MILNHGPITMSQPHQLMPNKAAKCYGRDVNYRNYILKYMFFCCNLKSKHIKLIENILTKTLPVLELKFSMWRHPTVLTRNVLGVYHLTRCIRIYTLSFSRKCLGLFSIIGCLFCFGFTRLISGT